MFLFPEYETTKVLQILNNIFFALTIFSLDRNQNVNENHMQTVRVANDAYAKAGIF